MELQAMFLSSRLSPQSLFGLAANRGKVAHGSEMSGHIPGETT